MGLFILIVLPLALVPLVLFTSGALRIALGLAFALFFPGYALTAALFPRKGNLDGVERLALSFGLSIAVVPLIGLILNYTPWGIRLYPILLSLLIFIISMAVIALYRRYRLAPTERFELYLYSRPAASSPSQTSPSRGGKVLTVLLLVAIAGAIGALAYVVTTPKVEESFTEFYILEPGVGVGNYPREVTLGGEERVTLGIVNREQQTTEYKVVITIDGGKVGEIGPLILGPEEKWEQEIGFCPMQAGQNQKVEFKLYKGNGAEPYETLYLWVDVKGS